MSSRDSIAPLRFQLLKCAVSQVAKQNPWSPIGILRQLLLDFWIHAAGRKSLHPSL
jgi:hypothetical protein